MPSPSQDFYEILQIHPQAEPEIVRAAYRRLVQKYHPDKNPGYTVEMDACMKKISEAYAVLKNPARRAEYDRKAGYAGSGSGAAGKTATDNRGGTAGGSRTDSGAGSRASTARTSRADSVGRKNASSGVQRGSGWINEKSGYARSVRPTGQPARSKPAAGVGDISGAPDIHGWNAGQVQARQRATAEKLGLPVFFRHRLKTGGQGPVMAVIPSGSFLMGSEAGFWLFGGERGRQANEGPQHRVSFAAPFAIGRFAVSFAEYDLFCEATGRGKPGDEGWGRGKRPVVNVDWHDAWAYCRWLSRQTGKNYRLPSEAEWEYACRAGTATPFWWSHDITTTHANYNGQYAYNGGDRGRFRGQTLPVDEFKPNPFGLYQVSGNVWEWCEDDWHKNYKDAPVDGSAWVDGEKRGIARVVRGGSWVSIPAWLRSAYRLSGEAAGRYDNQGFRLAQS